MCGHMSPVLQKFEEGGTHTTGGRLNTKKVRIRDAAKNAIRTLDPFVCITRCPASRQVADV